MLNNKSKETGQVELSKGNLALFNHCPIAEFLSCIQNSCDTIQCNQLHILQFFKTNLLHLKSEVDSCLNKLIGQELQIQMSQCSANVSPITEFTVQNVNKQSRENREMNVVIHGLDDPNLLTSDKQTEIITNLLQSALNVSVNVEEVQVKKAKKSDQFVAIVKLKSKKDKQAVFRNCHQLKKYPKKISITDDVPPSTKMPRLPKPNEGQQSSTLTECDLNALKQILETGTKMDPSLETNMRNHDRERSIEQTSLPKYVDTSIKPPNSKPLTRVPSEPVIDMTGNSKDNHSSFWNSQAVKVNLKALWKIGNSHGYQQHIMQSIMDKHVEYNRQGMEPSICVCNNYCNVPWKRIGDDLKIKLPKSVKSMYKDVMNNIKELWNDKNYHDHTECFCKHALSHTCNT